MSLAEFNSIKQMIMRFWCPRRVDAHPMEKRLAPAFIELTYDALLKAFWCKSTLRLFLQQYVKKDSGLLDKETERWQQTYLSGELCLSLRETRGEACDS